MANKPDTTTAGAATSKKVSARTIELNNAHKSTLEIFDDSVTFKDNRLAKKEETFPTIGAAIQEFSNRSMAAQLPESYDEAAFELNRALVADLKLLKQQL